MIFFRLASASSSQATTLSGPPMSSSIAMTRWFAPPCRGPFSVEMPATTAEYISLSADCATKVPKVDALQP